MPVKLVHGYTKHGGFSVPVKEEPEGADHAEPARASGWPSGLFACRGRLTRLCFGRAGFALRLASVGSKVGGRGFNVRSQLF